MTATEPLIAPPDAIAGVTTVAAARVGLIADDHNVHDDGSDLPAVALEALAGVDLILHLGHMGDSASHGRGVLDRLASVAPVLAVRDVSSTESGELFITPADGDRVAGLTRVI